MNPPSDKNSTTGADLLAERHGAVLWVTVNRASKHNALSRSVLGGIGAVFRDYAGDESLKAAVITGAGSRYFAAGGDLHELRAMKTAEQAAAFSNETRAHFDGVRGFPVPVLAALNGDALGGGSELALACDFRLAAAHARVGFLQGRIAVGTGWGGGIDLMDAVGPARALKLLARTEQVAAPEALAIGLVDAVADEGEPVAAAAERFLEPVLALTRPVLMAFKALKTARRQGASRDALARIETALFADLWVRDDHWAALERVMPARK